MLVQDILSAIGRQSKVIDASYKAKGPGRWVCLLVTTRVWLRDSAGGGGA